MQNSIKDPTAEGNSADVICLGQIEGATNGESSSASDQQQQNILKDFCEKFASLELNSSQQLSMIGELRADNNTLQAELEKQKQMTTEHLVMLQAELFVLQNKQEEDEKETEKDALIGQLLKLQNEQIALLGRIGELEKQQKEKDEQQQRQYVSVDQFTPIFERTGELEKKNQQQTWHFDQLMKTCESIVGQLTQLQNDQNAILGRIGQLEQKQQQMMTHQQTVNVPQLAKNANPGNVELPIAAKANKPNSWDGKEFNSCANDYHKDLKISGAKCDTVQYKQKNDVFYGTPKEWRSVFAKLSISDSANSSGTFYFEIGVAVLQCYANIVVGFAIKQKPYLSVVNRYGTFALQSNGIFWANGYQQQTLVGLTFSRGDVFGFGVHLATRQMFFSKNGYRLVTPDLFISVPIDQLFPFVSLQNAGDQIEANFGPNFLLPAI
ncbi:hypothetical protein niasHT_004544 [Heterodera trifolii]|uniref:B30.2/SPRY domain-containing protein n=1 Tax=Heterodera trifolii TaxID=157864 RepID=A0ABD2M0P8_9BILA